jgi:Sulfotransferase family
MTDAPVSGLIHGATPAEDGPPVFILTASRSGSTLLRFMLDSHPELACPPETRIGETCATMLRLFYSLEHFGAPERADAPAPPDISSESLELIRATLGNAYRRYLAQHGKRRWCDKSLDTYKFAEPILKIYPEARFICLVRHCMDVIASGARNCPWGVSRYGFDPFVSQFPGNTVAAIGAYWLFCNRAILEFRDKNPDCCVMVRYEDLVTAPEDVMAGILQFIGARPAPGISRACFTVPHESRGWGDEKIWFTDRVSAGSMGQGVAVPAAGLPPDTRASINEILIRLSYRVIDDAWQSAVGRIDPRADAPAAVTGDGHANGAVGSTIRVLRERLKNGSAAMHQAILAQWPSVAGATVRLVVESPDGDHAGINWRFTDGDGTNLPAVAADSAGIQLMAASPATWMSLLERNANIVDEIIAARVRCFNPRNPYLRSDEVHAVCALLGLATVPVGHAADHQL